MLAAAFAAGSSVSKTGSTDAAGQLPGAVEHLLPLGPAHRLTCSRRCHHDYAATFPPSLRSVQRHQLSRLVGQLRQSRFPLEGALSRWQHLVFHS